MIHTRELEQTIHSELEKVVYDDPPLDVDAKEEVSIDDTNQAPYITTPYADLTHNNINKIKVLELKR